MYFIFEETLLFTKRSNTFPRKMSCDKVFFWSGRLRVFQFTLFCYSSRAILAFKSEYLAALFKEKLS